MAGRLIPQWRQVSEQLYASGQPGSGDWPALKAAGLCTVVNLRPDVELAGINEAAEVRAAGLRYLPIPVDGAAGLTRDAAQALDQVLRHHQGPLLVHCGSGNRVGALLALREAWFAGRTPEEAIRLGLDAGLSGLESTVRLMLGDPLIR